MANNELTAQEVDAIKATIRQQDGWSGDDWDHALCEAALAFGKARQSRIRGQQCVSDAWQPISTAPKDKLVLLAAEFDQPGDWRIKIGEFHNGEWRIFGASWEPTRWQPLPPPPAIQAQAGDAPTGEKL